MFVILQKYDFSSKSQPQILRRENFSRCLWYCKSTIFQANHNRSCSERSDRFDVCDTAKVRFFKQITTANGVYSTTLWCLWYCKSTIFQANHNSLSLHQAAGLDVCDTAKVRFLKQITTLLPLFCVFVRCLWYCKSTIFQANHNTLYNSSAYTKDVCDTAKVRFFKQITMPERLDFRGIELFAILQKCDFSSKSQVAITADLWGMVVRMTFSTCCGAWAMCRLFVWRLLSFLVKMFGVLVLFCIFALAH